MTPRDRGLQSLVKHFRAPKESLGDLDAEAAATLIAAAADIALIVDAQGIIKDVAFGSDELSTEWQGKWLGRPWAATVTVESRPKVEALLRDATALAPPRWRHLNHPSADGPDVRSCTRRSRSGPRAMWSRSAATCGPRLPCSSA